MWAAKGQPCVITMRLADNEHIVGACDKCLFVTSRTSKSIECLKAVVGWNLWWSNDCLLNALAENLSNQLQNCDGANFDCMDMQMSAYSTCAWRFAHCCGRVTVWMQTLVRAAGAWHKLSRWTMRLSKHEAIAGLFMTKACFVCQQVHNNCHNVMGVSSMIVGSASWNMRLQCLRPLSLSFITQ